MSASCSGVPSATTSPPAARAGAQVDDPVGALDQVEVVLDKYDGVAGVRQAVQHPEQIRAVLERQARSRLVENIERAPRSPLRQLRAQLDALRLAAAQVRRGLAQADVPQAHVIHRL